MPLDRLALYGCIAGQSGKTYIILEPVLLEPSPVTYKARREIETNRINTSSMEVVAALSSVIAVCQLVTQLVSLGKTLKKTVDEISHRHFKLQELAMHVVDSLEHIEHDIKESESRAALPGLRESLSTLIGDLEHALHRCHRLLKPRTGLSRVTALLSGPMDRFDIELEISRIEKRINRCHQQFFTRGHVRVELSVAETKHMAEHLRAEMHDRFDRVEKRIHCRINEAEEDPSKAQVLVGMARMSGPQMQKAVRRASLVLDDHPMSSLENQYLRTMIKTLTHSVSKTPMTSDSSDDCSSTPDHHHLLPQPLYSTHFQPVGDPTHERHDAVMETLRILRLLRGHDCVFSPEDVAHDLERLSTALSDIGMYEDSLQICEQAVKTYRLCAFKRPDLQVNLCWSLINLSASFGVMERYGDALVSAKEAIAISRTLKDNETELSMALLDASIFLINLGQYDEAMKAIEEAVEIRRVLATKRPELYISDFAVSLSAASISLLLLGRCEEALQTAEKAVEILRGLSREEPEHFRSILAHSLDITSHMLSQFLRFDEALEASRESVQIFRDLAQTRPEVFSGGLALSLRAVSIAFRGLGQYDSSLEAIEEAVQLQRTIVRDRPDCANATLASLLDQNCLCLVDMKRAEEALKVSYEATGIFRSLTRQHPKVFDSALADSLRSVSKCFSTLGRNKDAVNAIEESIEIYHCVSRDHPVFWAQGFGDSFAVASSCYSKCGRFDDAVAMAKSAVGMYKLVANQRSEIFKLDVDRSLAVVSACLGELGTNEEAVENARQAVDILARLRSCPQGQVVAMWFAQTGAAQELGTCLSDKLVY